MFISNSTRCILYVSLQPLPCHIFCRPVYPLPVKSMAGVVNISGSDGGGNKYLQVGSDECHCPISGCGGRWVWWMLVVVAVVGIGSYRVVVMNTVVTHQTHLVQWTWNILLIQVYPGVSDECDPHSSHPSHENWPSLWRRIHEDGLSWCEKWVWHVIAIHCSRRLLELTRCVRSGDHEGGMGVNQVQTWWNCRVRVQNIYL